MLDFLCIKDVLEKKLEVSYLPNLIESSFCQAQPFYKLTQVVTFIPV